MSIDKYSTANLIRLALKAEWTDNYGQALIPTYLRNFYRFKTVVCLLINREPPRDADLQYDGIWIATIDGGSSFSYEAVNEYWWVCLKVGYGITRRWWFAIEDGST